MDGREGDSRTGRMEVGYGNDTGAGSKYGLEKTTFAETKSVEC